MGVLIIYGKNKKNGMREQILIQFEQNFLERYFLKVFIATLLLFQIQSVVLKVSVSKLRSSPF